LSAARRLDRLGTPLSSNGLLAYSRIICGVRVGSECLPPDVEREYIDLFRRVMHRLNYLAGKPAYAQEAAEEHHRDRGNRVLITGK
jgi:hypothetical protein